MQTLRDVLPWEFFNEHMDTPTAKFLDVEVLKEYDSREVPWGGKHKNVHIWWMLANGKSVGFNENPSIGWSFPVISSFGW